MPDWESLSQVRWNCKYHVVIVLKHRKRVLYGKVKRDVGEILRDLARQKKIAVLEGHRLTDHVHMCLKILRKQSVVFALGFMKGKNAVRIQRKAGYKKVTGMDCWFRGYCVSTVRLDEETIKNIHLLVFLIFHGLPKLKHWAFG